MKVPHRTHLQVFSYEISNKKKFDLSSTEEKDISNGTLPFLL